MNCAARPKCLALSVPFGAAQRAPRRRLSVPSAARREIRALEPPELVAHVRSLFVRGAECTGSGDLG